MVISTKIVVISTKKNRNESRMDYFLKEVGIDPGQPGNPGYRGQPGQDGKPVSTESLVISSTGILGSKLKLHWVNLNSQGRLCSRLL